MAKLNLLLMEFANKHAIQELSSDDRGIYRLSIDGMEIDCFEKFDKGYFCSRLVTLAPQENNFPTVLKDLMHHALIRAKSHQCSLGLGIENELVLSSSFDLATMNLYDFCDALENFVNALEEYKHFASAEPVAQPADRTMIITP